MNTSKMRAFVMAVAAATLVVDQLGFVASAHAKRAKCVSVPVPGQPGTFVVTCSTNRP